MTSKQGLRFFFVANLPEIHLFICYILSLRPCQLPLKVSDKTNNWFTFCIDPNLQWRHAVSLRQHDFLVDHTMEISIYELCALQYIANL